MLRSSVFTAIAAAFGILASGPGLAQTPDALTPAKEGICDPLQGGTPSLYGLCVAYCEAQDLDEMFQQAKAGGAPGERILARYRAKMQVGDPDMPCIVSASACPCFNINLCDPTRFTCGFQVTDVAEVFMGLSCAVEDTCNNVTGFFDIAEDFCTSSVTSGRTQANAVVFADDSRGLCIARSPTGGGNGTGFILDGPTARVCLNELNTYDGNEPADGFVNQCMLGN